MTSAGQHRHRAARRILRVGVCCSTVSATSSRNSPATIAVTGAISSASTSARPMPASSAVTKLSQPAQPGSPGSNASIQGSASQSNSFLQPEPQAGERQQCQAERLEEDAAELGREELAGGGAGGVEDHLLSDSSLSDRRGRPTRQECRACGLCKTPASL